MTWELHCKKMSGSTKPRPPPYNPGYEETHHAKFSSPPGLPLPALNADADPSRRIHRPSCPDLPPSYQEQDPRAPNRDSQTSDEVFARRPIGTLDAIASASRRQPRSRTKTSDVSRCAEPSAMSFLPGLHRMSFPHPLESRTDPYLPPETVFLRQMQHPPRGNTVPPHIRCPLPLIIPYPTPCLDLMLRFHRLRSRLISLLVGTRIIIHRVLPVWILIAAWRRYHPVNSIRLSSWNTELLTRAATRLNGKAQRLYTHPSRELTSFS